MSFQLSRLTFIPVFMFATTLAHASPTLPVTDDIKYEYIGEFTKEQAQLVAQKIPVFNHLSMQYSLDLYKIYYTTPAPDGTTATVSGLVVMPKSPVSPVAMISYAHGTRVNREDVPSRNNERNLFYLTAFASSAGYMLVMPDYLGYGDSSVKLHPYVQADSLAETNIHLIRAAKKMAEQLHYPLNNKLYLAGYSEGGFTTNVTYEKLLADNPDLPVTAVASGSAPYDWDETLQFIANNPGPRATLYLALFMYSMQTYHHYWDSLDAIFAAPYNQLVPKLMDGSHQAQEILDALPSNPYAIFNPGVLENIINGSDKHAADLKANFNHYNFTATAPFLLVGSKGDHDVPYHGAEIAYDVLKAKSNNVYIKSVSDDLDHLQALPLVTLEQIRFFQQYD